MHVCMRIHTHIHTSMQAGRQTGRQTSRQTGRQTDIHTFFPTWIAQVKGPTQIICLVLCSWANRGIFIFRRGEQMLEQHGCRPDGRIEGRRTSANVVFEKNGCTFFCRIVSLDLKKMGRRGLKEYDQAKSSSEDAFSVLAKNTCFVRVHNCSQVRPGSSMVLCRFASSFHFVFSSSWLPSPVVAWTRGRLLFIARWCCSRRLGCHFCGTLFVGFSTGCLAVFGGVLFGGSYLFDSMEVEAVVLRPPEVRLTVEFQFDVERSIVNTLLAPLQLEELDCSVKAVVYPTA